jgi:hypothetical protein
MLPFLYYTLILSAGKDSWNLTQTMDANGLTFELVNHHVCTAKDASVEMFLCVRELNKGNNNSLMS